MIQEAGHHNTRAHSQLSTDVKWSLPYGIVPSIECLEITETQQSTSFNEEMTCWIYKPQTSQHLDTCDHSCIRNTTKIVLKEICINLISPKSPVSRSVAVVKVVTEDPA